MSRVWRSALGSPSTGTARTLTPSTSSARPARSDPWDDASFCCRRVELLAEASVFLQQGRYLVADFRARGAHELTDTLDDAVSAVDPFQRTRAGDRLDPANAGRNAGFGDDAEHADVAGASDVGAAAQLHRESVAHGQHPYFVAVLLAEQGHGTLLHAPRRSPDAPRPTGGIGLDLAVDLLLHSGDLFRRHGLRMREVETQALRGDQRAFLLHMVPSTWRSAACIRWVAE